MPTMPGVKNYPDGRGGELLPEMYLSGRGRVTQRVYRIPRAIFDWYRACDAVALILGCALFVFGVVGWWVENADIPVLEAYKFLRPTDQISDDIAYLSLVLAVTMFLPSTAHRLARWTLEYLPTRWSWLGASIEDGWPVAVVILRSAASILYAYIGGAALAGAVQLGRPPILTSTLFASSWVPLILFTFVPLVTGAVALGRLIWQEVRHRGRPQGTGSDEG